jgi:signal transduction histidine kinase
VIRYRDKTKHANELKVINNQIIEQKASIEKQAAILKETNEKISFLNKDLEEQVEATVTELSQKDKIIDSYSFVNSHKLRSPVSSIIGLSSLFNEADEEEKEEIIKLILLEAKRLDDIVYDIQQSLEDSTT